MTDRLNGWKEICSYLCVSERRVVLARGYPVHRERTGAVYALCKELDEWAMQPPAVFPQITADYR